MINPQALIQLKAFARQDGALTGLLWIASFAMVMTAPESPWGNLLAFLTPFFVGWRLTSFRNGALNGKISLRRAFAYCTYTFIYASLIFAIAQYVYFRFLDHGLFSNMMANSLQLLEPFYEQSGIGKQELEETMKQMMDMRPIHWAIMFMIQNIVVGLFLALPIALVCKRTAEVSPQ